MMNKTISDHASTEADKVAGSARAGKRSKNSSDRRARKEKMLHTRIPESLDREIKRQAGSLGMSVSTVVRHILLNTFNLVEDIVADSTNLALSITGEKDETATSKNPQRDMEASPEDQILGWQEAILNLNAVCGRCNKILASGTGAAIGIRERPGPYSIICKECLAKQMNGATGAKTPDAKSPAV